MSAQQGFRFKDWRAWTSSEIQTLRNNANLGAEACAVILGRSTKAVKNKAARERISLRPAGEPRGLLMGQARNVDWMAQKGMSPARLREIRDQVVAGEVDMAELERRIIANTRGGRRQLCFWCGTRNVERQTTGLCEPCHLRELARAHRDIADRTMARRELDAARQQSSRARRRGVVDDGDDQ